MTTQEAKAFLKKEGYYTDTLWSTRDILYDCTDDQAQDILSEILTSDYLNEMVFDAIDDLARSNKFSPL